MGSAFEMLDDLLPAIIGVTSALLFVAASYFLITLDRQRATSTSKDDTQVGIKLVLFGLMLAGVQIAAGGVDTLLSYLLGGAKGDSGPMKVALASILVGVATVAILAKVLLPRTNSATYKQPERFFTGFVALQFGVMALMGLHGVLTALFTSKAWADTSGHLASTIVSGAIAFLALGRFGSLSGWTAAPPRAAGFPPQAGGGYPPQGGGYPPQGGGYPPQGGGYPPQGGGYPPQGGGGYPPQQGGY